MGGGGARGSPYQFLQSSQCSIDLAEGHAAVGGGGLGGLTADQWSARTQ